MEIEYQIIKRNDNFCIDENQFISLLETNQCYKILKEKSIIEYKNKNIKYNIKKYEAKENKEIMFIVNFSIEDENQIEEFEKFDKSFLDFLSKFNDFSVNILWDDISKYYAEKMYPKIAYIENLLRKIIYYFMGKNVGNNWTKKCFPKEVENSIKSVKYKNKIKNDENVLYYADFIQLNLLLFLDYPDETISQKELINNLNEVEVNDICNILKKYKYKSNWDRYFQPIINKENLETNLTELYYYRNLVAHNRKIRMEDKNKTEKLSEKIEKILLNCLSKMDEINVPEEEKENLENMSCQMLNPSENVWKKYPGIALMLDSFKIGIETISPITFLMNSFKMETFSPLTSAIDSIKTEWKFESPVKSEIDAMKIDEEILSLNSSINKEDEDKK